MKTWRWALSLWLIGAGWVWAETTQLVLDPPINKTWRLTFQVRVWVQDEDAPEGLRYEERRDRESNIVVTEEAGQRWLTSRLARYATSVNGAPRDEPYIAEYIGQPIGFAFDAQGRLLRIRGLEQIASSLQAVMGEAAPTVAGLTQRYRGHWERSLGEKLWVPLAGRTVEVGQSWPHQGAIVAHDFGLGKIPASGQWTYLGRLTPAADSPARLVYTYGSEQTPTEGAVGAVNRWLSERVPALAVHAWSSFTWKNAGEVVIDPDTLIGGEWRDLTQLTLHAEESSPVRASLYVETVTKMFE